VVYGIRQPASYDALVIRRYERLFFEHFGRSVNWMLARHATTRGMQLFGIDGVLDGDDWLDVDTAFGSVGPDPSATMGTGEIVRGSELVQTFSGVRDGLDSIRLRFERPASSLACSVDMTLEDVASGTVIAKASLTQMKMQDSAIDELGATMRFEPVAHSSERLLRLRASSPDGEPGRAFILRARSDWDQCVKQAMRSPEASPTHAPADSWRLERDGRSLSGGLYLDLGFADHELHAEARVGRFTLYGFDRATSLYHTVPNAHGSVGEKDSWDQVTAPGFDPTREVVLERDDLPLPSTDDSASSASRTVTVGSEIAGHIRLHVDAGAPGWLVTAHPWYPGWTARVNGNAEHIWRANYAFTAIHLPAAACDVELDYGAPTFWLACKLALAAIVACATWLGLSARAR
jgi:hypothetical protein